MMHDGPGHFCFGNTSHVPIVCIFVRFGFHTECASLCPTTALVVFMHTMVRYGDIMKCLIIGGML